MCEKKKICLMKPYTKKESEQLDDGHEHIQRKYIFKVMQRT